MSTHARYNAQNNVYIYFLYISDLNASNTFSYMPVQRYVPTWEMYQHDGKFQMRLQAGI